MLQKQKNGEAEGARRVLGPSVTVTLIVLFAILGASSPGASAKGKACEWDDPRQSLTCHPAPLATGCIGIKNETKDEIRAVALPERGLNWSRLIPGEKAPSFRVSFKPKQEKRADFKAAFVLRNCEKKVDGRWTPTSCYNSLSRWKTNENKGGGCGCPYFSCLKQK